MAQTKAAIAERVGALLKMLRAGLS